MATNTQSEIDALRSEIGKLQKELAAQGADVYEGARARTGRAARAVQPAVRSAGRYLRSEGTAVADAARNHPAALSGIVALAGLAGLAIGYLLASSEDRSYHRRYWY